MFKEKVAPKYDPSKTGEVEELLVLKQHRAKPYGSEICRMYLPGEKYLQKGMDKLQVLVTDSCTLDLNAFVPPNTKRKAPKTGEEKYLNTPTDLLGKKIDALVNTINELVLLKKK